MDPCCGSSDSERYDAVFDRRFAGRVARRYAAKGPTSVERRVLTFVTDIGIAGETVMEIGGGVGELQLELLARGAARTVNLELSHEYETEAARLIAEAGLQGRVTRLLDLDLAAHPDAVDPADVVVLNRVVCCYPDAGRLLSAAARRARRAIVFSHPPRNWINRGATALVNGMQRLRGQDYRAYAHDPGAMEDAVRRQGFEIVVRDPGMAWCVVGATRAP